VLELLVEQVAGMVDKTKVGRQRIGRTLEVSSEVVEKERAVWWTPARD
jgi:hypothetical protein